MQRKNRPSCSELKIRRKPVNDYGTLEPMIRAIRDARPLDLNAEFWRQAHPDGTFEQWRRIAHEFLLEHLHYDPGPLDLRAETHAVHKRDGFIVEEITFNTTAWNRVPGCLLLPTGVQYPVPGLVVFHAWGGPMLFGRHRIVNLGRDHPVLIEHRNKCYSGKYLAEQFAKAGYAVVVIDNFHFGERIPRGLAGIPEQLDPFELSTSDYWEMDKRVRGLLGLGLAELGWAGVTWAGLNWGDDHRCIDYLQSRPEVDAERIGCTGLSGGGWRTNLLAALDRRIKASVSCCWMTTGDYQQVYKVQGGTGTFNQLPGVWRRMDVPDLSIMAAPNATMVISNRNDHLFCEEAQDEAARQIRLGFEWAGAADKFKFVNLPKPHCYDAELQQIAIEWFDRHLKGAAAR